ncbi:protein GRINL1A [Elgaria multicarinata webbii]|uniref:protein GRINL1A n=1 Tax=Elgaria multicarinata webbii TaxID=159646 RepID=UPI002FCCD7A3
MAGLPPADPLRGRSLPELREMLSRQERLLGDRKFICRLPDKGKKISDFAEKLKIAIAQEEELRRTTELLSAVRLEFQKKQDAIESSKQKVVVSSDKSTCEDSSLIIERSALHISNEVKPALQNKQSIWTEKRSTKNKTEVVEVSSIPQGNENVLEVSAARHSLDASKAPEHNSLGKTENPVPSASSEALCDAFERISFGWKECEEKSEEGQNVKRKGNPFQNLPNTTPQTPHYIEVLELRAKNPVTQKSKFKTNVLPAELSGSSRGSPGIPSPGAPSSSVSAEERRRRDRKHLDDITAARLPPLHHEPTQLLSIGESITIQIQQKEAFEEMQAKLAAQKLAERLGIKMVHYEPEGEMVAGYREVRDENGYSSAED